MAFLENLGKKVGEAAQAAAKKSGELVETTKLNANIGSEEDKIKKLYNQVGKTLYEKYNTTGEADEAVKESFDAIKEHERNIANLREKIMQIKGVKLCTNCGAEMERTQVFCAKCGTKNEIPEPEPVQESGAEQNTSAVICPACGATLQAGSQFCANCGSKIG